MTHEELTSALSYEPDTGLFRWLVARNSAGGKAKIGRVAGSIGGTGYWYISIFRRKYRAGRLAWFYVHGQWPINMVDHINGDRLDNRISNLREATNAQNQCNRRATGESGIKGVYKHSQCDRWAAEIKTNGRKLHLGLFSTLEEAAAARREAAKSIHGAFARDA